MTAVNLYKVKTVKQQALEQYRKGRLDKALALFERVCKKDAYDNESWMLAGIIFARTGKLKLAEQRFRHLVANFPNFAHGHYYLGAALEQQGMWDSALACYNRTVSLDANYTKAYYNLGNIYRTQGSYEKAATAYKRALEVNPYYFEAINNLGSLLKEMEKLESSIFYFKQALKLRPDDPGIHVNLGNAYQRMGDYGDAISEYQEAISLNPMLGEAYSGMSSVFLKQDKADQAIDILKIAGKNLQDDGFIAASEASVHEKLGDFEQAYQALAPQLEEKSVCIEVATAFVSICRYINRCDEAVHKLEKILEQGQHPATDCLRAHFALGKHYDRTKNYDHAFSHYRHGNELVPYSYDREKVTRRIDALIQTFSSEYLKTAPRSSLQSELPVFIVGMPRSGTTLVEQILASHPQVYGAGELIYISKLAHYLPEELNTSKDYPYCMDLYNNDSANRLACGYLDHLRGLSASATRITDKLPGNFLHLGLISLLFPDARVVHCLRDPMDNCLSCYFQNFEGYHPYAYRLDDLGFHYCQYQRLMSHWLTVLDIPILTISYEEMVTNQEDKSRELVEFCELEWDEQCINFHEHDRIVKTASYDQVRQPIYRSSVHRWRNYEKYLLPLQEALDCVAN